MGTNKYLGWLRINGTFIDWSDPINCTPKADVVKIITNMRLVTEIKPTRIIMSKTAFGNVMVCDEIRDYLKYVAPHLLDGDSLKDVNVQQVMLATYFGVEEVLVDMDSA